MKNVTEQVFLEKFGSKEMAGPKTKVHMPRILLCYSWELIPASRKQRKTRRSQQSKRTPLETLPKHERRYLRRASWDRFTNPERIPRFTLISKNSILQQPEVLCGRDFRPNPTVIYISVIRRLYLSISDMQLTKEENAICDMTIPIPRRKKNGTSRASWRW